MNKKNPIDARKSDLTPRFCPLYRRLAVVIYDGLLVVALWMVATAVVVIPAGSQIHPGATSFQLYLLAIAWAYFAISWRRGGQTLGMKAWRVRLVGDQQPIGWHLTAVRFFVAIAAWSFLGLGFLWSLFHPQGATWHDLASGTRLVVEPKHVGDPSHSTKHENPERADQHRRQ